MVECPLWHKADIQCYGDSIFVTELAQQTSSAPLILLSSLSDRPSRRARAFYPRSFFPSSLRQFLPALACKRLETFRCGRPRYARHLEWRDRYA